MTAYNFWLKFVKPRLCPETCCATPDIILDIFCSLLYYMPAWLQMCAPHMKTYGFIMLEANIW